MSAYEQEEDQVQQRKHFNPNETAELMSIFLDFRNVGGLGFEHKKRTREERIEELKETFERFKERIQALNGLCI